MAQRRSFTIGCIDGSMSRAMCARVFDAVRTVSPRTEFVDGAGANRTVAALAQALTRKTIDIAVVDGTEMPSRVPAGIEIVAIPKRSNPYDVLVSNGAILDDVPEGETLVSRFPQAMAQVLYFRPDLEHVLSDKPIEDLFGDLERGRIAGFVCPAAEVEAGNHQERVSEVFTSSVVMPAPGQGIAALLARIGDRDVEAVAKSLNDQSSIAEYGTERMLLAMLPRTGRCHVGVLANYEDDRFHIEGALTAPDGTERVVAAAVGLIGREAQTVGELAEELSSAGGQMMKSHR